MCWYWVLSSSTKVCCYWVLYRVQRCAVIECSPRVQNLFTLRACAAIWTVVMSGIGDQVYCINITNSKTASATATHSLCPVWLGSVSAVHLRSACTCRYPSCITQAVALCPSHDCECFIFSGLPSAKKC